MLENSPELFSFKKWCCKNVTLWRTLYVVYVTHIRRKFWKPCTIGILWPCWCELNLESSVCESEWREQKKVEIPREKGRDLRLIEASHLVFIRKHIDGTHEVLYYTAFFTPTEGGGGGIQRKMSVTVQLCCTEKTRHVSAKNTPSFVSYPGARWQKLISFA